MPPGDYARWLWDDLLPQILDQINGRVPAATIDAALKVDHVFAFLVVALEDTPEKKRKRRAA
jgi:hypothetical protein